MPTPEAVKRATGGAIKALRENAKLSKDQMGISRQQLHNIEQGKSLPNVWTLACIAKALKVSLPALVAEIERRRSFPAIESGEERMLEGGILLVIRTGHMDASKTPQFQAELVNLIKQSQAKKVLLDFAAVECDYSQEEQYHAVMALLARLREVGCYPMALGAVGNATIDAFGLRVMDDHGCPARLFANREDALAWLRLLPDHLMGHDFYWRTGPNKECDYLSDSWFAFTGILWEQAQGLGWSQAIHEEDLPVILDRYERAWEKGKSFKVNYRLRHKSGEYRWVTAQAKPVFGPSREVLGFEGYADLDRDSIEDPARMTGLSE